MHDSGVAGLAVPTVHAVTNDEIVARPDFHDRARRVMAALGARGALQLRAPQLAARDAGELAAIAAKLAEEQARTGAWLVVNDRVDVALLVGARGVQLSGDSMAVLDACRVVVQVGDRLTVAGGDRCDPRIGASVHSLEEGIAARIEGASWGVVSNVLRSTGDVEASDRTSPKSDGATRGVALAARLARSSGIPIVVIGGVTPQHVAPLRNIGVHGVAAIRGIWDRENAERAASEYLSAYDSPVGR